MKSLSPQKKKEKGLMQEIPKLIAPKTHNLMWVGLFQYEERRVWVCVRGECLSVCVCVCVCVYVCVYVRALYTLAQPKQ